MICPKCRSHVPDDQEFCMGCGYRVRRKPADPDKNNSGTRESGGFKWQYAVIALLLVAVGFMVFRLLSDASGKLSQSEFDQAIENINDQYADVRNGMDTDYTIEHFDDGTTYYYDAYDNLRCVSAPAGVNDGEYGRVLYYTPGGHLFFAYYDQNDSHSFYFQDDQLIRWRYCSDKTNPADGVNEDQTNTDDYATMEEGVLAEAAYFYSLH